LCGVPRLLRCTGLYAPKEPKYIRSM
jgi:hypothetical protein